MDKKEILKERFKSAISSAVKVIADNSDIEIKFGKNADSKNNNLNFYIDRRFWQVITKTSLVILCNNVLF